MILALLYILIKGGKVVERNKHTEIKALLASYGPPQAEPGT